MTRIYSIEEMLRFAVKIEEVGIDFYKTMSGRTKSPDLKELYLFLMNEEKDHKKTFQDLLNKVAQDNPSEFNDDYNQYLRAMVDKVIFQKEDEPQNASDLTVIDYAIEREKDSVLFYLSLKDCVPVIDQATVDRIIEEERKHILKFLDIKEKIG